MHPDLEQAEQRFLSEQRSAPLHVGRYGGSSRYLDGRIDDVRVYNIALSQPQVQTDMNAAAWVRDDGAVGVGVRVLARAALTGTVAVSANASTTWG